MHIEVVIGLLLTVVIVFKSKDLDGTLSMIGNHIIKPSLTVLPSPFVQVPPSVNKLDSRRNSKTTSVSLGKVNFCSRNLASVLELDAVVKS